MSMFERDHAEDMNDPEYARQHAETTIELLRSQIRYQQAEIARLEAKAHGAANLDHEWRMVGVATGVERGRYETYTEALAAADRLRFYGVATRIQHRLVTAWEDIQ